MNLVYPDNYRMPVTPGSKMWRGMVCEKLVSEELKRRGIDNQLMPVRHPFDIFTEKRERIDVKSSWTKKGGAYSLYFDKAGKEIDFYIVVGMCEVEPVYFVLPTAMFSDVCGISIRYPKKGKWTWTHNRFDLLEPAADWKEQE